VHNQACKFEHIISPELDRRICSFLGHPKTCPHGNPIPPGDCCNGKAPKWGPERRGPRRASPGFLAFVFDLCTGRGLSRVPFSTVNCQLRTNLCPSPSTAEKSPPA
jgi:hypothetical protein